MFLGCSLVVFSLPALSFPPSCPRAPQRSRHRASWRPAVTGCTIQTAEGFSRLQGFEKTDSPGRIRESLVLRAQHRCENGFNGPRVIGDPKTVVEAGWDPGPPPRTRECARFAPPSFH